MEFGPIWRAMLRNKAGYVLIAVQIAVTMAIMVNAIAIIQERSRLMARPSGIDEENTFYIASQVFAPDTNERALIREDLEALRSLPGVRDAINSNSVPLRGGGWSMGLQHEPGDDAEGMGVAIYFTDEHGVDTFDLDLIAGRNFAPEDVSWNGGDSFEWAEVGIISKAMAATLYPDEDAAKAVGRTVYINRNDPVQIIGVVERLQAPWSGWDSVERSMLVPLQNEFGQSFYVVRTEPGRRDELIARVEELLASRSRDRIVRDPTTMAEARQRSYLEAGAMVRLLTFVVTLLTLITGLGIVGLASFSVSRRRRQIGTRRALGGSRGAILRYFMVENLLLSSAGTLLGAVLAVGLNVWMVSAFELEPMAWHIVPTAMLTLIVVGQVAAAGPARRATLVPPAVATRAA